MKKSFSLAVCAFVFTTNPLFAMEEEVKDLNTQIRVVNKTKYTVESSTSTAKPARSIPFCETIRRPLDGLVGYGATASMNKKNDTEIM